MKFLTFSQTKIGSSLNFSALGGRGKEKKEKPAAKNFASPSEGEAEGGCGGNSASPEPKRSPAALLVQSRVPQKSFLFLLEEKNGRAQNKKLRRKLFCGIASEASGGGAERQFRSKKFRAKFKISHQSQLSPFWERIASRLRRSAFGLCARRKAKKSHGGKKEMEMDFIFSYLK
jgi:hypothetical protein